MADSVRVDDGSATRDARGEWVPRILCTRAALFAWPPERDTRMSIDSFFHYLHHRYFERNYGSGRIPLDRWFGTFHDGSEQAHTAMRRKRAAPAEVVAGQGAP